jgi:hypothetical protein
MMLTLFCPSRGRPKEATALMESFLATKASPDTELVFLVDKDDPTRSDYPTSLILGEPTGDPTGPLNRAALASEADIVGFTGDDSRLTTPGWDVLVEGVLRAPGFCWGYDGTSDRPWPSTAFISRSIIQTLGWMVPPTLRRGFFDIAWTVLADSTKTVRIVQANFPHDNSRGDPSKPNYDPTFQVPPDVIAQDERAFQEWMTNAMPRDVQKLRHLIYA